MTQLISQLHSVINCLGNPAPVLWLSPVSLVYSGTMNLSQPPLSLSLSLTSFSLYLSGVSLPLSPWLSVLCLRFYVCLSLSEDEVSICCRLVWVCVCTFICTSVVHPAVWCRFQWPIVAKGSLGCFDGHIKREWEREGNKGGNRKRRNKQQFAALPKKMISVSIIFYFCHL